MAKGVEQATQTKIDIVPPSLKKVDRSLKDTPPSSPKGAVLNPSSSRPPKASSKSPSDVVGKTVMVVSSGEKRPLPTAASSPAPKRAVTQTAQADGQPSGAAGVSLTGVSTHELAEARTEGMYCAFDFFTFPRF